MKSKLLMAGLLAVTAAGGTALVTTVHTANAAVNSTAAVRVSPGASPQVDTPEPGDTPDSTEVTTPGQAQKVDQNKATETPDAKDASGNDTETAD